MKKFMIFLILIIATLNCKKLQELKLNRSETQEKKFERIFFYEQFSKHKSLKSFMQTIQHKKHFLSKHIKTVRNYYSDYQIMKKRARFITGNSIHEQPLYNIQLSQFNIEIGLGTPPQYAVVMLDTGSSDLWVTNGTYFPNQSTTFSSTYSKFGDQYGDGSSLTGYSVNDTLSVGGLKAQGFQFGVVPEGGVGGLFGVAYPSLSGATPQSPNFIVKLYEQEQISEPVFSLYLTNQYNQTGSKLILGGVNSKYYDGPIHYVPVILESWYTIKYEGFEIGGQVFADNQTILDSGTTLIHAPTKVVNALTNLVGYIDPSCSNINNPSYPVINVLIDGQKYPLTSEDYIFYSGQEYLQCIFAITNHFDDGSILGDQFLKVYYSVFDQGNNRIGLARANHTSS